MPRTVTPGAEAAASDPAVEAELEALKIRLGGAGTSAEAAAEPTEAADGDGPRSA